MSKHLKSKPLMFFSHIVFIALCLAIILPFLLLISSSVTSEEALVVHGYNFIPKQFSLEAYEYLWRHSSQLFRAYGITLLVTGVGTLTSLVITSMLAYPLSRYDLPGRRVFTFLIVFTMLFNGGLVPTYLIYVRLFGIKNTLWALIVPGLLMNGFHVMLTRTFFQKNIPPAVIESAQCAGATEFQIYRKIILPLSLPIMATIGLMTAIRYWNDWYNGMIYLNDPQLYSLQVMLNEMLMNIRFLSDTNLGGAAMGAVRIPGTSVRMAIAVVGALPIISIYPFFQKYFVQGITLGSVKE